MDERILHSAPRNDDAAAQLALHDAIRAREILADVTDRACCCPAGAMVRVVMPATPARPRETELLLCGHHYRVSRQALAAAMATVRVLPGVSDDAAAWLRLDRHGSRASVN